ncbi:hypothetical protein LLG96_11100 [bacterium]|nr:hypothetical protein [bacterium]
MLKSAGITGRSDNKVDTKGRISIPAPMRKALAPNEYDEVAVVYLPEGHLLLFNKEYWSDTIQQRFLESEKENKWRAILKLSQDSHMSTVDNQGRITIPSRLLAAAGIKDEAVIIGAVDRAFVWAPDRFESWMQDESVDSTIREIGIF